MSRKSTKSDLARLDAMRDQDIDYSDIPELDEGFFEKAAVHWPPRKKQLTIRLDGDVLDWLKRQGRGYQTRINAILRAYYEAHKGNIAPRP
ncbi:MAG: BrnA antitoxin family protein [Candidatus Thiosymbion ectosymbiont of Robbea hypermnestra]|nr:BrnA antitoxin family protein [Candidatus Thiosymbion ectosymbiont of Robbea hypermnestra]